MKPVVLVTRPEFEKAEAVFRAADDLDCLPVSADEAECARVVAEHKPRALVVGPAAYAGPLYAALANPSGALIARFGVGHDGIDKPLARQHGIVVTNTPGVLDASVAEHTLWLIGCLARHIPAADAHVRTGAFAGVTGIELGGKTLGILGPGNIGRRVAAAAHFGFGMRVMAWSRRPQATDPARDGIDAWAATPEELFRACDILSVHLRSDATTRHFVNAERLAWLRPTALLVNTARGAVLDEAALFDALAGGRLAGAALDVFEYEPYRPVASDKDLRTLRHVVLTPHVGSNTREANHRMAAAALENVRHFLAGKLEQLTRVDTP
jgi:lactate dehydrogenase-like 2-hydroxyacid dehydrogenase